MCVTSIERPRGRDLSTLPTLVRRVSPQQHHKHVLQTRMDRAWDQALEAFKLGPSAIKLVHKYKAEYDAAEGELVLMAYKG